MASTSTSETFKLTAHCLCKANTFTTDIPTSKLPLPAYACHCTSCRHLTGALYSIDTTWPQPRDQVDTSKLKRYSFSPKINVLFCGTCSTPLFFDGTQPDAELGLLTGTLENKNVDLVKLAHHMFVNDTVDGGATEWLRSPNTDGAPVPRYQERSTGDKVADDWPSHDSFTGFEKKAGGDAIPFWCHCKGVNFELRRHDYGQTPAEKLPRFVDPKTHKLIAGFDACDSCRLQSGVDTINWTFAELLDIGLNPGDGGARKVVKSTHELVKAVDDKDESVGSLAYYRSSPDVQRFFCGTCSATVFYAVDSRIESIDIAIGLLDAPDGARAEGFLSWAYGGPISHHGDVKGGWREGLWKNIAKESEEWRVKRNYPKNWRRVAAEEKAKKEKEANASVEGQQ